MESKNLIATAGLQKICTAQILHIIAVIFLSVYFVLSATVALLREKGDEASAANRTMYLVCTAVSVAGNLIAACTVLTGATGVATMISSVVEIVALFMYISFLGRSVHTLSE